MPRESLRTANSGPNSTRRFSCKGLSGRRNILSGNVEEIRHSHGTGIFEISYLGNESELLGAIQGKCSVLETSESHIGINRAKIHIEGDDNIRSVIAAANENVALRSFSEVIPTMNDIFIRAVNEKL